MIKNHEINEHKMLRGQHFQKIKLINITYFNCFKNKKKKIIYVFNFFNKKLFKLKNKI